MNNILLSIVVPHYGTPELLKRCVASVPQREDVQLIVIEDKEQRGAGWARNRGLEQATGQWVTFVDADDYLPSDFETVLDILSSCNKEDIVMFSNRAVMSDDPAMPSKRENYQQCFNRYFATGDETSLRYQMSSLCGKFFRRSFIENHHIRCDEVKWSNDTFFALIAGYEAKQIAVFKQIAYIITEHSGSLTSGKCGKMEEWSARYEILIKKRDYLLERGELEWADEYIWMLRNLFFINRKAFFKEMGKLHGTPYFTHAVKKAFVLICRQIISNILS